MLAADDIPGSWTPRQRDTYEERRRWLSYQLAEIQRHQQALSPLTVEIRALER